MFWSAFFRRYFLLHTQKSNLYLIHELYLYIHSDSCKFFKRKQFLDPSQMVKKAIQVCEDYLASDFKTKFIWVSCTKVKNSMYIGKTCSILNVDTYII